MTPSETLDLLDYRRRVADLYHAARDGGAGEATWRDWRDDRDRLLRDHPQSPLPPARREGFSGLPYGPHDDRWRTVGRLEVDRAPETFTLAHSSAGGTRATRIGVLRFVLDADEHRLSAYWLEQYGGGLFVPFRDATSGDTTYGGGRYLLDTAKSADLGAADGGLVLDFNYATHPSCVHDERWSCPLALTEDRLPVAVTGGEHLPGG
jgi:uncharacterized protein